MTMMQQKNEIKFCNVACCSAEALLCKFFVVFCFVFSAVKHAICSDTLSEHGVKNKANCEKLNPNCQMDLTVGRVATANVNNSVWQTRVWWQCPNWMQLTQISVAAAARIQGSNFAIAHLKCEDKTHFAMHRMLEVLQARAVVDTPGVPSEAKKRVLRQVSTGVKHLWREFSLSKALKWQSKELKDCATNHCCQFMIAAERLLWLWVGSFLDESASNLGLHSRVLQGEPNKGRCEQWKVASAACTATFLAGWWKWDKMTLVW